MNLKILKRIFKSVDVNHITFSGGEPFLAERFAELVLFARRKDKTVSIITNGTNCESELLNYLQKLRINYFQLPIHSYRYDVHDWLIGGKGACLKSIETINYLNNIGASVVVNAVITKQNYDHIYETLSFINDLGVKMVMLNRFNIGGEGVREGELLQLSPLELEIAFNQANKAAQVFKLFVSSNICIPACFLDNSKYKNIKFTNCGIPDQQYILTIDFNGNLRICNHSPIVLGNVFRDSFEKMLSSEYVNSWHKIVPNICSSCNKFDKCKGGCRAASEQIGLTNHHADPLLMSI